MEKFDLVDRDDNIIGVTDKPTAHASGQLHRVAAIYVFDPDGRLYVQVHKKSGGLLDHSVGGHVSQGESYEAAAAREAEEELGITQPLRKVTEMYSDEGPDLQHMFGVFDCVADPSWHFEPNDEVAEIHVMDISDIRDQMVSSPEKFTRGFMNSFAVYEQLKANVFL